MSWRDSNAESREDYRNIFDRDAHFVGFTEVYGTLDLARAEAVKAGYRLSWGPTKGHKCETLVAVRKDMQLIDAGSRLINPKEHGPAPKFGHSARYLTWASARFEDEEITFAEGHWVTGSGRQSRYKKQRKMSRAFTELAAHQGSGRKLFFGAGDTNEDDRARQGRNSPVFDPLDGKLTTIFDELRQWPPTHQGRRKTTIDIIFSFDTDARVKAKNVEVHRGGNSDHFQVSAFYDIAEAAPRA